jgi:hypothetical protein
MDDLKSMFSKTTPEAAKDTQPGETTKESAFGKPASKSPLGKLGEILGMKKAMECTYTYNEFEGKVYTDGTNMRTSSKIQMGEELVDTNTILTSEYLYSWMGGQTTGTKIALKDFEYDEETGTVPEDLPETPDYFANMNYTCEEKAVDSTMFELPAGVEFTEFNISAMKEAASNPEDFDMCGMCGAIPTATEKEACMVEFECE